MKKSHQVSLIQRERFQNSDAAKICQLQTIPDLSISPGKIQEILQYRLRVKRFIKRRWRYVIHTFKEIILKLRGKTKHTPKEISDPLKPGDKIRVKSKIEIELTLDRWNKLGRCGFMEEMWSYCGTTQYVLKRIDRFLDERDYQVKKCRNIVILNNVHCNGTMDFGPCDRSCFFFWREEWLEKI